MLELLLAKGLLQPQPAAPHGGNTGLQWETVLQRRGTDDALGLSWKGGGRGQKLTTCGL